MCARCAALSVPHRSSSLRSLAQPVVRIHALSGPSVGLPSLDWVIWTLCRTSCWPVAPWEADAG